MHVGIVRFRYDRNSPNQLVRIPQVQLGDEQDGQDDSQDIHLLAQQMIHEEGSDEGRENGGSSDEGG